MRIASRCLKVRNLVSHQRLHLDEYERALENFTTLAKLIGRVDVTEKISSFVTSVLDTEPDLSLSSVPESAAISSSLSSSLSPKKKKDNKKETLLHPTAPSQLDPIRP